MLPEYKQGYIGGTTIIVPVLQHMKKAHVRGIARMRYRPKTARTGAWWAELNNKGAELIRRYEQIKVLEGFGDSTMQYQGVSM